LIEEEIKEKRLICRKYPKTRQIKSETKIKSRTFKKEEKIPPQITNQTFFQNGENPTTS
jgi:hypothetical protein